jgi:hypothetical protein
MEQNVPSVSAPGAAVGRDSEQPIFDSQAYIQAWRQHLGAGEPWDLTLPDGFAPLMRVQQRHCRVPLRVLQPTGTWVNPTNVVIPFRSANLDCLFSRLRERRSEWDALEFVVTVDGAPAADAVRHTLRRHGLRLVRWHDVRRPYVRIDGPWEDYYRRRRRSLRGAIAHRVNKMARCGGMRVDFAHRADGLHALETFFQLHHKRWASRGQRSLYAGERYRNFVRSLLATLPADTWRVARLLLGEQVIAASVEFMGARRLHKYVTAMDPDFSAVAPGKMLLFRVLQDAFQNGFAEVDLGPGADGHSSHKAEWATGEYLMRRFLVTDKPAVAVWLKLEPGVTRGAKIVRSLLRR